MDVSQSEQSFQDASSVMFSRVFPEWLPTVRSFFGVVFCIFCHRKMVYVGEVFGGPLFLDDFGYICKQMNK